MKPRFHLLVRAVILANGRVLLAHLKDASNTHLPGGHVEPGEGVTAALERELREELGVPCRVGAYLGAVEHEWEQDGVQHHEINHIFEVSTPDLQPAVSPATRERDLEFYWSTIDELEMHNLQPHPLRGLLRKWSRGDRLTWWASTVTG